MPTPMRRSVLQQKTEARGTLPAGLIHAFSLASGRNGDQAVLQEFPLPDRYAHFACH